MGLFDSLKNMAKNTVERETKKAVSSVMAASLKGKNHSERFVFGKLPQNVEEIKLFPEASLDTPFKTAALTIISLCLFKSNPDEMYEMLNFLKGPENVSNFEKQFINERLKGKEYLPFSYFDGVTPENGYTPQEPMTIEIYETPYSFDNENRATLWVKSGGADNMRSIKFRKKPSTGQWFLNDIQCLSEIRPPKEADPWA